MKVLELSEIGLPEHHHELYIYHPYFNGGIIPNVKETDLLIILGGPMSPNNEDKWILKKEN